MPLQSPLRYSALLKSLSLSVDSASIIQPISRQNPQRFFGIIEYMELHKLAQEYFSSVKPMQLATISNGQPWICTVYFVADEDFNLYWMSARERQHSREIAKNSKVAVAVVKDSERKQALQITGEACEVSDESLEKVHTLYTVKYGPKDYDLNEIKRHLPEGRAYWMVKPTKMYFWDEVNFPDAPKQEVLLSH